MNNIIIIVPILNEKKNIEILFKKLNTINIGFDLLFIASYRLLKEIMNLKIVRFIISAY